MVGSNPLVERVARFLYAGRNLRPQWDKLRETQRDGYRQHVEEVLLAAMNAGLRISECEKREELELER